MIKQNNPLVTIAIPTYNRADGYLKQALTSVVRQTYQNIEIIVSDNCSTDNTEMVVKKFGDPRIRYLRQKVNIKPVDNFNFCLQQARGYYIQLLHDDDMIDDDFIEICMKAANYDTDIGIIRTGMRRIDEQGNFLRDSLNRTVGLSTEDFFSALFEDKTPMHVCMTLFNTEKFKQIGGLNPKYNLFADVLAEITLAAKFGRVDIEDVKASYRMHSEQNSSANRIKDWCNQSFVLFNTTCDLVTEKKALLKKKGKSFFFRHNCKRASKIKSPIERYRSYFIVFKSFGFLYSIQYQFRAIFYYFRYITKKG